MLFLFFFEIDGAIYIFISSQYPLLFKSILILGKYFDIV